MNLSRTLKSLSVGVSLTLLLSFSNKDGNYAEQSVKMPYKKYGYTDAQAAARLLDRFSFGASPGQVNEVVKMGLDNWFEQQLQGKLPDDKVNDRLANFKTLSLNNETIVNTYMNAGQVVRFAVKNGLVNKDSIKGGDKKEYQQKIRLLMQEQGFKPIIELQSELVNQKIIRAAYSNNQLHELLTDFWFNHFNVSITKQQCQQYILNYERDAIRPNIIGHFKTILEATAKHPAMLEFLDNANSVSNSKAKKAQGLNENYAREIMELHTLGVDGGYTQADVTSVARALTGWSVLPLVKDAPGRALIDRIGVEGLTKRGFVLEGDFLFRADKHDDEPKTILGKSFPENGGYKEGEAVIKMLANHSSTTKFICTKLATRFVSDTPSVSLVKNMMTTFEQTNGNIKAVLIAMVNHADFWNQKITREKIKSPFELVISAVRATNAEVNQPMQLFNWCNRMGQKLYFYQAPTGFPDRASYWINTGALLNRMNFGLAFAAQKIPGIQLNLPALNQNHEPESTTDALKVYSNLLLPERDHAANIARLSAMVNDDKVAKKIDAAAAKIVSAQATEIMEEEMMPRGKKGGDKQAWSKKNIPFELPSAMGNNTMIAQVAGIIIGSPEFQRK
ncbi:MAG: DUF1800 domain-containing protein [Sphingobacteriia bacterium]|nr:MAG: DUF1800 domain-containing protein [Sphingobacteriia bacterium]